MSIFRRKEKRSNDGSVEVQDPLLRAMLDGSSDITKEQALQIPTLAACVNIIADRISALPIKLYREDGKEVTEITGDKRLELLNHDTGDTINASELKKLWVRDYFLGKGSYTYIGRNMYNEPTALYYVDETRVAVIPNADPIFKTYALNVNGRSYFPYQFLKILRNSKGYGKGVSIIEENPLALAIYYNTMKFENANIRKGGNKRGFLKARSTVGKTEMDVLKEAWRDLYSNSNDNADNIVVLNEGVDFQEASNTSVELQLNENKQTNAAEICKLFCMPAAVLNGKADDATISQFVQNCLTPPINTVEAALDHDLLTENEKAEHYYFAFDTSELTRGDFAARMNGYAVALQNNIYQLDEIREKEDLPPLGFNFIRLGLDAVLVDPETKDIYTPNTGKLEKMSAGHLTDDEIRAILEARGRHYIKGEHGYFMGSVSDGHSGGSSGGYSSGNAREFAESTYKQIGHIDVTDKKQVEAVLSDFEQRYKDSDIEHCIVITENGDVFDVSGGRYNVDPAVLGDKTQNSINEHNHVTGLSQYSFSKEDVYESCKDGSKVAMAFDEKYKYSMTFDNKVSCDKVHDVYVEAEMSLMTRKALGEIVLPENEQHEVVKLTCESLGIKYERWLI